ncbi:MAG: gamma-glutamyltransferase [Woeseiaceae bacterium]|nr:gamma-glutamyltransferase [Woeseiaceae bacterium]
MRRLLVAFLSFCLPLTALGDESPIIRYQDLRHPVLGDSGMVASQNFHASRAGAAVLADGGNAVDAAVAVGFALAVTLPRAGNLGGGGFMLIHDADTGENTSIDYREMAPPGASRDMFLDENGDVDNMLARFSHLSAGTPGTVAGMWAAHQRYGSLPWKRLLEPAIKLASEGVPMTYDLSALLSNRRQGLCQFEAACGYFYKDDGSDYQPGDLFKQPDLAATLTDIAEKGPDGFYSGRVAGLIAAEMEKHGGLVDEEALAAYRPSWRVPLKGSYRGYDIVTMSPPSSGGVHVIQMLNIMENFDVSAMGAGSADSVHLVAESARLAYADRSKHLGDPDFWDVPVDWLTSKSYAKILADRIDMTKATPSESIAPGVEPRPESEDTTHYSVIDKFGNAVSNTYTLNFSFGSHIAVEGAGFLLNNEMDDFSAKPGTPNAYGLLGGEANAIEPGKRPLSSMTPTIVFADGNPWFATGSPGGSRIITTVLQMISNMVDHGMNLASATAAPRIHHQWYPDRLQLETGFSPDTARILEERGHFIVPSGGSMGSVQAVSIKDGVFRGASDPRRPNAESTAP